MRWLVYGVHLGDSLLFHFSGHSSQKVDNDERNGFDETLCPLDYESNDMILDDDINKILVRLIPHRAKLNAIIDACHSGTVLDLPHLCRINKHVQRRPINTPFGKSKRQGLEVDQTESAVYSRGKKLEVTISRSEWWNFDYHMPKYFY